MEKVSRVVGSTPGLMKNKIVDTTESGRRAVAQELRHVRGCGDQVVVVEPTERLEHDLLPECERWSGRESSAAVTAASRSTGSTAVPSMASTKAEGGFSQVHSPSV